MRIGFIGLGTMGALMAGNLQKAGYTLAVHDVRQAAAEKHIAAGATWQATPKAVAEQSDIVFTSLPGPPEVEQVALGENGLLAGMRSDAAWFDLSTIAPSLVRRLHTEFATRGAHMLDAPVSGGPSGAASGRLAIWVGGEQAVFDRHKSVLDAIGDQACYIGPIGSASVAKLVHNCAGYAINVALAEVFTMGVKAGVDPLVLFEAIRQGALGRSRVFDRLADQFLPGVKFDPPAFALEAGAQGCVTGDRAWARVQRADEDGKHHALAEMTEALNRGWGDRDLPLCRHAAAGRACRRGNRSRCCRRSRGANG